MIPATTKHIAITLLSMPYFKLNYSYSSKEPQTTNILIIKGKELLSLPEL